MSKSTLSFEIRYQSRISFDIPYQTRLSFDIRYQTRLLSTSDINLDSRSTSTIKHDSRSISDTGWFKLNSIKTNLCSRNVTQFFWDIYPKLCAHTSSVSPCQPVSERRLVFVFYVFSFFAEYLVVYFASDVLGFANPKFPGREREKKTLTGRQGLTEHFCVQKFKINL